MLVGMLYERRHTRLISEFGVLATSVPVYQHLLPDCGRVSLPGPSSAERLRGRISAFIVGFITTAMRRIPAAPRPEWFWLQSTCCGCINACFTARSPTKRTKSCPMTATCLREELITYRHGARNHWHGHLPPALLAPHGPWGDEALMMRLEQHPRCSFERIAPLPGTWGLGDDHASITRHDACPSGDRSLGVCPAESWFWSPSSALRATKNLLGWFGLLGIALAAAASTRASFSALP